MNVNKYLLFGVVFFTLVSIHAQGQYINTIAGTPNTTGYSGNGGPASAALLFSPSDVAVDKIGNLYITDFINNVIRKVDTTGIISTIAGTGLGSGSTMGSGGAYTGDGGPATAAELNGPFAIVFDKKGNIFFADGYNHAVRKIDNSGIITTFAGGHTLGYTGDGGPATAATMDNPVGLAFDKTGNLYIADDHNNAIRKVDTNGIMTTFAGNHTMGYSGDSHAATGATLNDPVGVGADQLGNVYIADAGNNVIRKVDVTGTISTFAGSNSAGYSGDGGPATGAKLSSPERVVPDDSGNVYIADFFNNVVRKVNSDGIINAYAGIGTGAGTAGAAGAFSGDGGLATAAELYVPMGIAISPSGLVYICDRGNEVVRVVGPENRTGINTISNANDGMLAINPNPAAGGSFTVILSTTIAEPAQVVVSDLLGQTVKTFSMATNTPVGVNINVPPGIYILSATTANGNWNKRIVVK